MVVDYTRCIIIDINCIIISCIITSCIFTSCFINCIFTFPRFLTSRLSPRKMPQVIRTADGKTIVIHNSAPTMPSPSGGVLRAVAPQGAVIRAVTPQGAVINLPASLVSGSAQSPAQTIKIVQVLN